MTPPTIQRTRLPNRSFITLSGPDAPSFLNAIVSGTITAVSPTQSIYTLFLTAQGRLRCDMFVSLLNGDILIECDAQRQIDLVRQLTLYKLRSAVTITPLSTPYAVFCEWSKPENTGTPPLPSSPPSPLGATAPLHHGLIRYTDPRHAALGARLILTEDNAPDFTETASLSAYHQHRVLCGVPEAGIDMPYEKAIPLEHGLERFLYTIDWEKGCYVGQELTARTKYRGLVRKGLVPVRLTNNPCCAVPTGAFDIDITAFSDTTTLENAPPITNSLGEEIGEMRSVFGNIGMAFVRLNALESGAWLWGDSPLTLITPLPSLVM